MGVCRPNIVLLSPRIPHLCVCVEDVDPVIHCVDRGKRIESVALSLSSSGLHSRGGCESSPARERLGHAMASRRVYAGVVEGWPAGTRRYMFMRMWWFRGMRRITVFLGCREEYDFRTWGRG